MWEDEDMNQNTTRLETFTRFNFFKKNTFLVLLYTEKMKQKQTLTYGCTSFTKWIGSETTKCLIGAYIFLLRLKKGTWR